MTTLQISGHAYSRIQKLVCGTSNTFVLLLLKFTGERFDFILDTNQAVDNYWVKALAGCGNAVAILRYDGATVSQPWGDKHKERKGVVRIAPET